MQKSGKLELTWVGKNEEKVIEPRILVEDKSLSYGDPNSENMLIHGDNLIALQALQQDFAGKIKCIYIDPPYNTGSAFEHYDDNLEHSIWLDLMKRRLMLLKDLLADDGIIFVQIDDNEQAYLKILMDEVFGRKNYLSTICVKMSTASGVKTTHRYKTIIKEKEMIVVFAKDKDLCYLKPQYVPTVEWDTEFQYFLDRNNSTNPNDWLVKRLSDVISEKGIIFDLNNKDTISFINENRENIWRRAFIRNEFKKISQDNPDKVIVNEKNDKIHYYYRGREMFFLSDKYHSCFCEDGYKNEMSNLLGDFWTDINTGKLFSEGDVEFRNSKKPEFLVARIIEMTTKEGDYVLDSFLGSGTTAAVAHKMRRKYIGVELGNHAYTHCKVRLDNVIDGDRSGISNAVNWQGGGGYHFYELAPSLLVKHDKLPIYQVNPEYTFEMLCEAICKLEGFRYKPSGNYHGYSSEQRFIHITNEYINSDYVNSIASNLYDGQSLLIYGTKIQSGMRLPDNIEIKKIPKDLLDKCDFESEVR